MKQQLTHPDLLVLKMDGTTATGGSQEWYKESWQRMSGCGPTAASNIIWHMSRSRPEWLSLCDANSVDKEDFFKLMTEMFSFITPGMGGVNSSAIFAKGIIKYGEAHGVSLSPHVLEIPALCSKRPDESAMRDFILAALQSDAPVAFLNLSNGALNNLEGWHWVTVIGLDTDDMTATISDQGEAVEIDLAKWLKTSKLGGALVYLA